MWALIFLGTIGGLVTAIIVGNARSKPRAFLEAQRQLALGPPKLVDGAVVTLVGTVKPIDLLTAPISRRSCVALHVKAFMGAEWLTRFAMTRFVLATDQGDVVVEHFPEAKLALPILRLQPPYDVAERFLTGVGRSPFLAIKAVFEEQVVEPGDRVAVYGVVRTELEVPDGGEVGFRDSKTVVRLTGDASHPLAMGTP